MKILLVHKFFKYNGGADVFFFETVRVLEERGHRVACFSTRDPENLPSPWSDYFSDAPDFRSAGPAGKLKALWQIPYNREARRKFERLLDDFRPDLVHVFNIMTQISPSVLLAARERQIPVVISLNDYKHICPNYKLYRDGMICEKCRGGRFYQCLLHRCSHRSLAFSFASTMESYVHRLLDVYRKNISLFLFASDFMAEKTEEFWGRKIPRGKLMNPFHVSAAGFSDTPGRYGLYFGRLIDEKGVDVLLKALAIAPEVPFKIVGDGPDLERLKAFAAARGLDRVEFTGPKWGSELNEYLREASYVVVPSVWHENFPYVVLQAFDAGKPVIAARRGGIPEMVGQNRGVLYQADDAEELAARIRELEQDRERGVRMGKEGRRYVETTFNDDRFYESLMTNYRKVYREGESKDHE